MYQICRATLLLSCLLFSNQAWAVDSYRFLHVTIDTPWFIFIFLFFLVCSPMILSAILHWHNALKRDDKKNEDQHDEEDSVEDHKHD